MSNLTFNVKNSSSVSYSINNLLDSLGFIKWITITTTFVLPIVNFLGLILCSLSTWIFFNRRKFKETSFFYYRLLCIVYIFHLIHNIPRGLLWVPQYFPQENSYSSCIYKIYYGLISNIFYHYEDVIQMAILIDRMTIFSPWIKSQFNKSPQLISFLLFITCLFIDAPYAFSFKIKSLGTYYVNNQLETFYFLSSSNFSTTPFGRILLAVTTFFLNLFLTLVVGVTLNIVSLHLYKSYLRQRSQILNETQQVIFTTRTNDIEMRALRAPREKKLRKAEMKMFLMAFVLCSISILTRVLFMCAYIFYFVFFTFTNNLIDALVNYSIFTLVPTVSIFVFYAFNKIFRKEFKEKILRKKINSNQLNLINTNTSHQQVERVIRTQTTFRQPG